MPTKPTSFRSTSAVELRSGASSLAPAGGARGTFVSTWGEVCPCVIVDIMPHAFEVRYSSQRFGDAVGSIEKDDFDPGPPPSKESIIAAPQRR